MGAKKSKQAGGTGAEALTYAERRALGHGTLSERLGKDSIGDWCDCRLTLSPCVDRDPVCTPRGYLFSREAILENLLEQKRASKRALAEWESARERRRKAEEAKRRAEAEAEVLAFERRANAGSGVGTNSEQRQQQNQNSTVVGSSTIAANRERGAAANNAWGTSAGAVAAAEASAKRAAELRESREASDEAKPDVGSTRCPASGEKLRLKDLVSVRFYRPGEEEEGEGGGDGEGGAKKRKALPSSSPSSPNELAFDPVTREPITNSTSVVVLLPSGWAMSEESYRTCVKPDGIWKGKKVEKVIRLQRGGTGYAAHDGKAAEAASHFALGAGSGRADVRGQLAAGGSRFGLKYTN